MKELWTDKYRPKTIAGYVFKDPEQKRKVENWIAEGNIPHVIFSGNPGIGKTTLAKLLANELNVHELDYMQINSSRENSVDDVRDKIIKFVQMIPFGKFKMVVLDEADYLSLNAQAALRGVLDEYASYARFVFTCNYPNKLIPALHSRCQGFHIAKIDQIEFTARVAQILITEGISMELDVLDTYIKATYPDLRKCIGTVQENSIGGVLLSAAESINNSDDWKLSMVDLFKAGKIHDARKLLCGSIRTEEMEDVYRWLYDNVGVFGDEKAQHDAILIIKQGLVDHTLVIDPEINLSATLIKLARLKL
jgi:DNA polymerase III delta prime subunit